MLAVYELKGHGIDGEEQFFRKPWFMTTLMFLGMSMCLPLAYLEERMSAAANGSGTDPVEPLLAAIDTVEVRTP